MERKRQENNYSECDRPFSETCINVGCAYYNQQYSIHCTLLKNILSVHIPNAGHVHFALLDLTDIIQLGGERTIVL
jgi:hypothetical protein